MINMLRMRQLQHDTLLREIHDYHACLQYGLLMAAILLSRRINLDLQILGGMAGEW